LDEDASQVFYKKINYETLAYHNPPKQKHPKTLEAFKNKSLYVKM
jgi:hypothetical protein